MKYPYSKNGFLPGSQEPIGQNIFTWLQGQVNDDRRVNKLFGIHKVRTSR